MKEVIFTSKEKSQMIKILKIGNWALGFASRKLFVGTTRVTLLIWSYINGKSQIAVVREQFLSEPSTIKIGLVFS